MPTILAERIEPHELATVAARFAAYYDRHGLTSDALTEYRDNDGDPSPRSMVRLVNDRPGDYGESGHDRNLTAILRRATGSRQATGLHYDSGHPHHPQLSWYVEE